MSARPPAVEAILGPQGSGRSARLARRLADLAPSRGACLVVDPCDHWTSPHHAPMPEGAAVLSARTLSARGVDPSHVIAVAMHRMPGAAVGIDDVESLALDRAGWARVYAAASASGCLLVLVVPQGVDGLGGRLPGPGRVAALAAHGA